MVTINSGEWSGAGVATVTLEGRLQSFAVSFPSGESKSVPICPENSDYQRLLVWNAANGNPLELE